MSLVLVVDDQRNMRTTLLLMLKEAGHQVVEAEDGVSAIESIRSTQPDVVLTDLRLGDIDGLEVLRQCKQISPFTEVIVMTAYGTIESAVEAMHIGACDYIQKPFSEAELVLKLERAIERRNLTAAVSMMATDFRERFSFENIIGRSTAVRDVISRIIRIAPTDATVLITGESGTGKELVARAIHANSKRADRLFVPVNAAAISETLLESELFGHARGAFTGAVSARKGLLEEANGGTFFFDEIGELSPALQAKILRALQEGEIRRIGENKPIAVDVRVIAATHIDIPQAIAEKRFRQDLYYRLNVTRIHLPPLRERRDDIPQLAEFFLRRSNAKMKRDVRFGEGVLDYLSRCDFPGNIRELENTVEQGVALAMQGVIRRDDIMAYEAQRGSSAPPLTGPKGLQAVVDEAERLAIVAALREYDGNKERVAEALELSHTTLWRKMKRLNISG